MSNDNDKIISLKPKAVAEVPPEPINFKITYTDGSELDYTGYLICTPNFVGVGELDGTIKVVVPLSTLKSIVAI